MSLVNLALQKPAYSWPYIAYRPPELSVDGISHTKPDYFTQTGQSRLPYIAVDLGQKRKVAQVTITNRGDCCCKLPL